VYVEAWFSVERNYNDFLKYALVVGVRVRVRVRGREGVRVGLGLGLELEAQY